jgi:hypothetical protein
MLHPMRLSRSLALQPIDMSHNKSAHQQHCVVLLSFLVLRCSACRHCVLDSLSMNLQATRWTTPSTLRHSIVIHPCSAIGAILVVAKVSLIAPRIACCCQSILTYRHYTVALQQHNILEAHRFETNLVDLQPYDVQVDLHDAIISLDRMPLTQHSNSTAHDEHQELLVIATAKARLIVASFTTSSAQCTIQYRTLVSMVFPVIKSIGPYAYANIHAPPLVGVLPCGRYVVAAPIEPCTQTGQHKAFATLKQ